MQDAQRYAVVGDGHQRLNQQATLTACAEIPQPLDGLVPGEAEGGGVLDGQNDTGLGQAGHGRLAVGVADGVGGNRVVVPEAVSGFGLAPVAQSVGHGSGRLIGQGSHQAFQTAVQALVPESGEAKFLGNEGVHT